MLKQIIFILKSDASAYMQTIISDIRYLAGKYAENGIQVSYLAGNKTAGDFSKNAFANDILYVADDARIIEEMLGAGHFTIALQHDHNHRADLHKALYAMSEIRELDFDSFLKAYERLAGLPWHILDTERLTVRETTINDVDAFYRIYSDPVITRYMDPLYRDIDEEKAYAAEYIKMIYNFYGYGIWTVLLRETEDVIGRAGISWREGHHNPELGFVIARAFQRKGYAEEVLKAILDLARKELELDTVQALIQPENIASIKLCLKLGFIERDVVYLDEQKHLLFTIDL
jgi:RimJ/RimL family protein N-acetyltransferase